MVLLHAEHNDGHDRGASGGSSPLRARLCRRSSPSRVSLYTWPGRPSYGLDALIEQEALDPSTVAVGSKRHRAAYDAAASALVLLRLLDSPAMAGFTLEQVAGLGVPSRSATSATPAPNRATTSERPQEPLWTTPPGPADP
jgi:DNA polymerase III epsilon subunit-like protein